MIHNRPVVAAAVAMLILLGTAQEARAQFVPLAVFTGTGQNYIYLDISGQNTTIDVDHTSSWYITVAAGKTLELYGGAFEYKRGQDTTASSTLSLYSIGAGGARTLMASKTKAVADITAQFTEQIFAFSSTQTLTAGSYY